MLQGRKPSNLLPPVIVCHGTWTYDWSTLMDISESWGYNALLAAGYTVIRVFTGNNWGTNTMSPSGMGGTGLVAIDDAITAATVKGLSASTVNLMGLSMGGTNVLNWAWRNTSKINKIFLYVPMIDYGSVYDTGVATASLNVVFSASNKTQFLANCVSYDPIRNMASISSFGQKIAILAASDDTIIDIAGVRTFALTVGASLAETTGGHLSWQTSDGFNEFDPPRHYASP